MRRRERGAIPSGAFTLLQLLIEEVSGVPFAEYIQRTVLLPLGMTRSTFRTGAEGSNNVAQFFDNEGAPAPHNLYTASAAASLYSTANDMARFARAHSAGLRGEGAGRGVLSPQSIEAMRSTESSLLGTPHWGLGV